MSSNHRFAHCGTLDRGRRVVERNSRPPPTFHRKLMTDYKGVSRSIHAGDHADVVGIIAHRVWVVHVANYLHPKYLAIAIKNVFLSFPLLFSSSSPYSLSHLAHFCLRIFFPPLSVLFLSSLFFYFLSFFFSSLLFVGLSPRSITPQ